MRTVISDVADSLYTRELNTPIYNLATIKWIWRNMPPCVQQHTIPPLHRAVRNGLKEKSKQRDYLLYENDMISFSKALLAEFAAYHFHHANAAYSAGDVERMKGEANDVEELLSYGPRTAGGIMNTEFFRLDLDITAREAINSLQGAEDAEMVFYLYCVNELGHLVGVLSVRDAWRSVQQEGDPGRTVVSAVMTPDPVTIRPHASISEAIHLFTSNRISCLPVTGEHQVVHGILTTTDLLRALFVVQRWLETRAPRLHA